MFCLTAQRHSGQHGSMGCAAPAKPLPLTLDVRCGTYRVLCGESPHFILSDFLTEDQYWGIRRIGNGAFESTKLNSIVIPNSVTSIGEYAFRYMNNLKEISIPDSVTVLGSEALFRTPSLTALRIPAGVTEIGSDCFGWCSKLKTIEIDPENPVY